MGESVWWLHKKDLAQFVGYAGEDNKNAVIRAIPRID